MALKILIDGGGSIGKRHLRNLKTLGYEEIAVAEPDEAARKTLEGAEIFKAYEEALEVIKPDVVFVCTPTKFHVDHAQMAVDSGAHVFVEKPLSYKKDNVEKLRDTAAAKNRVVMVACNMRFHPGPAKVKELIDGGIIGNVFHARIQTGSYLPAWRPGSDYKKSYSASKEEGGAVLDCIHEIDLALWYFGKATVIDSMVVPAASIGLPEVDGLAEILLKHDKGAMSSVHLNFIQRDYRRCCQVIGEKGSIYWDAEKQTIDLYDEKGDLSESFKDPQGKEDDQSYVDQIEAFLKAVKGEAKNPAPLEEGIAALEIALTVKRK